jgi:micrococcal nuclease
MKAKNPIFRLLLLGFALHVFAPSLCHAWSGKVVHVADGDTITVLRDGKKIKVRLYGIDTPESKQWYGQNAKTFTSAQVMGKMVDVQEIDVDHYSEVDALALYALGPKTARLSMQTV